MLEQKDIEMIRNVVEDVVGSLKEDVTTLKEDVTALKEDVTTLKEDVTELKEDVTELKEDVTTLKENVTTLKENVTTLRDDVDDLKQVTEKTQNDVIKINLTLENIVMPRLCTIEDCYTSTYHRYAEGVEQFGTMQMDIDILKETATQHEELLQRLA